VLGQKARMCKVHRAISLEQLVPQDHFYRQVEAKLDLSFVRELVKDMYASPMGRPSIDPVVFFKLQLIMFFEGIRSERQLMETVNVNLAHRWFLGYDLDEAVPEHSSLTRIRDRYGLEVFQRFFEKIVELCQTAGLVWGKELYFDGSKVKANADIDKQVPRFYWEAQQFLKAQFAKETALEPPPKATTPPIPRGFVEKYSGERLLGNYEPAYERQTDYWVCPTDPDASPFSGSHVSGLGYHLHYVVDGGKARIILAALVTPGSIMDNTPMLDLARWVRFRWRLHPELAVGDAKYGTAPNIVGLEKDGIRAYLATTNHSLRTNVYPIEKFQYDAAQDCYICPQQQRLPFSGIDKGKQARIYRAPAKACKHCPVKTECTTGRYGRVIQRLPDQTYLDRVTAYHATPAYKKAMRKRAVWIEPLFGEAKQWHQSVKFRLRRLRKVNIQALITAAGQNIKRLLKPAPRSEPLPPAAAVALDWPTEALQAVPDTHSLYVFQSIFFLYKLPNACVTYNRLLGNLQRQSSTQKRATLRF
jgi:transposase